MCATYILTVYTTQLGQAKCGVFFIFTKKKEVDKCKKQEKKG